MRILVAGLCAIVMVAGCDSSNPRTPNRPTMTPSSPAPLPGPAPGGLALSGIVSADGAPLAGASVIVLDSTGRIATQTAVTGNDGAYSFLPFDRSCPRECLMVGVSKEGFHADIQWPFGARQMDFPLQPVVLVPVGEVVRGQLGPDMCAGLGYGEMACHRFAIKAPSSGLLEVSLSGAAFEFDADVVNPDGTFALYFASVRTPIKLEFPVTKALTYEVRVASPGPPGEVQMTATARQRVP